MKPFNVRDSRQAAVVIPTYDEEQNIADIVAEVLSEQKQVESFELQVVVADSSSKDRTADIVLKMADSNPRVHLLTISQRGIGLGLYNGFRYGIETLGADVLVEMDADFQHNPADIPRLLDEITKGYDVVIGSRFVKGSTNRMPWYRQGLSIGANQLIRAMLGLRGIREITTSFRAFTRHIFLKIDQNSIPWKEESFIPVPIFLVRMVENGARVSEIPITMHSRVRGYSKMTYWRYILDIARFSSRSALQGRKNKFI